MRTLAGVLLLVMLWPHEAAAQLDSSSFGPPTSYPVGFNNSLALAVGDLNNDGFADVVVTGQCYDPECILSHTGGIGVFINNGNGTFQPGPRYRTGADGNSTDQSVAIADMDGDGEPDLVVMNPGASASVSLLRGNGDGTFQDAVIYPLNTNPNIAVFGTKLTLADVDGDGRFDILVSGARHDPHIFNADYLRAAVSVLLNNGGGTFASPVRYDTGGYASATNVIAADVNGDGFIDIVVTNLCSTAAVVANGTYCVEANDPGGIEPGTIGVLLGNGNGTFQPAITYPSGGYEPHAVVAVDLNRDGHTDLLVANQCSNPSCRDSISLGAASVLMGNGDGSFQSPVNYVQGDFNLHLQPLWIAAGDIDGDGLVDSSVFSTASICSQCPPALVSVQLGNGDGTLQAPALYYSQNGGTTVTVADLNNDGKPDLVISGFAVLLNQTPRAATATTLISQANPSAFGQAATLTATISSLASGTPTGTVTFREGATVLGTAALANAVATLDVSNLSLGSHTIVASYSSDSAFRVSDSTPLTQVVKIGTTTAVSSSSNPSTVLQSVTFTATVTPQLGGAVSGTVTFSDGNTVLGSVAPVAGTAGFSTSGLALGTHSITAEYSGDANNLGSNSTALSQSVVAATTQVTVDTSPSGLTIAADGVSGTAPGIYQFAPASQHQLSTTEPQQVTAGSRLTFSSWSDGGAFTHTVTTPSNPVTYTATFKTQYLLTTAANPPAGGSITPGDWFDSGSSVAITATAASGYSFTGFSGNLSGTTNPNSITVNAAKSVTANFKAVTVSSVGTSPNPSTSGQSVTLTATVTSVVGVPSGSVTFFDGATNIGAQPLNGSGIATLGASLTTGSHTISVSYDGNGSFAASTSTSVTQTVNKASTSTSVSSSPNPAAAGQVVTFTALVSSPVAGRSGAVTFKDGGVPLGTAALNASGQATLTTSSLSAGTHSITAEYGGDTNFLGSSSSSLSQTVTQATTATTLTSNAPGNAFAPQLVTFTATVISSAGGIPTGTVTFKDGNKAVLGSAPLNAGIAMFVVTLSSGLHSIRAVYDGTASYAGSTSPILKVPVNTSPATTTLTSSPNPSAVGQTVTFTAVVTGSATPTGTVTFKDGGKAIGTATLSGGLATLSVSSLKRGSHSITATYSGDSNFGSSVSQPYTQVVN